MSDHAGHRERLKKRFLQEGLDNFEEHNVLELLLFYCIPQKDTNLLAHDLIKRFGGLPQVLDASVEELKTVKGIGDNAATLLTLMPALLRYYTVKRGEQCAPLTTTTQCGEYLVPYFMGRRDEVVFLLCLDAKCGVLCCKQVGSGNANSAGLSIRTIVETAMSANATSAVLAHNHPSGVAIPSREDVLTTRRVAMALDVVGVQLVDHIVVADEDFVSLVESGRYRPEDGQMVY